MTTNHPLRARVRVAVAALAAGLVLPGIVATGVGLPGAAAAPGDLPLDARGFVGPPARCDGPLRPVLAGRTPVSVIAICATPRGQFEYRGMRLRDRASLLLPATAMANDCYRVRGDGVDYTVSPHKLLLTAGMRIVRDETMLQYSDLRPKDAETATVTKTSGS